ncbi:MAG: ATP phosphoribosyltransferase regulatory subunit, partial [Acidobacteriia bacterium]|nr:ATP phosphoribosyltransferase regulatory subunit [Terriglobia bacterium]
IAMEVLSRLGVRDFQINLGHMEYFAGVVERIGLNDATLHYLRELIDIKDITALTAELKRLKLDARRRDLLLALPHLTGGPEILRKARSLGTHSRSRSAIAHLDHMSRLFSALGLGKHLTIDLSEVRGLDYYTGIVFRIFVPGLGFEIGGGGRYDSLFDNFGSPRRAVGFSFSLERLMQCANLRPMPPATTRSFHLNQKSLRSQFAQILKARQSDRKVRLH